MSATIDVADAIGTLTHSTFRRAVDENIGPVAVEHGLAAEYRITGTPTIVMFAQGAEAGRVEGSTPQLRALVAAIRGPFESQND